MRNLKGGDFGVFERWPAFGAFVWKVTVGIALVIGYGWMAGRPGSVSDWSLYFLFTTTTRHALKLTQPLIWQIAGAPFPEDEKARSRS